MSYTLASLITHAPNIKHHALLVLSRRLATTSLSSHVFGQIAKAFCGISLSGEGDELWASAARHPDIFIADRERSTLRLEDVQSIKQLIYYSPNIAKRRLFFVDNCSRMNINAANSILKTIEEPNIKALFVFTASNIAEVLPTISSRCQRIILNLSNEDSNNIESQIEPDDWIFVQNVLRGVINGKIKVQNNMWEQGGWNNISAVKLSQITQKSFAFAKKYSANVLQQMLITLLSVEMQNIPVISGMQLSSMRFFMSDIRAWQQCGSLHPSSEFWLSKIMLRAL